MKTQTKLEILIAEKTSKLIKNVSLGTANRYLGNEKSLAKAARALRKANKHPKFQELINEIEYLQWRLECLEVESFLDSKIEKVLK